MMQDSTIKKFTFPLRENSEESWRIEIEVSIERMNRRKWLGLQGGGGMQQRLTNNLI